MLETMANLLPKSCQTLLEEHLTPATHAVLSYLMHHAERIGFDGWFFATNQELLLGILGPNGERLDVGVGVSIASIWRGTADLEDLNFIESVTRKRRGIRGQATCYRVNVELLRDANALQERLNTRSIPPRKPMCSLPRTRKPISPVEDSSLPPPLATGSIAIPKQIFEWLLPTLGYIELKLFLFIFGQTMGMNRKWAELSYQELCHGTFNLHGIQENIGVNSDKPGITKAIKQLEQRGLLHVQRLRKEGLGHLPNRYALNLNCKFDVTPKKKVENSADYGKNVRHAREAVIVSIPAICLDILMAKLRNAEYKVLLYLIGHSFSCHQSSVQLSHQDIGGGIRNAQGNRIDFGTGLSCSTVIKAVKGLEAKGLLTVRRRRSQSSYYYLRNVYTPNIGLIQDSILLAAELTTLPGRRRRRDRVLCLTSHEGGNGK